MPPIAWLGICSTRLDGQQLRRVETERVLGIAPLQVVGVAAAQVEDRPGAEDVHPVADERAVGAPERKLAVLRRAAADRGACCAISLRSFSPQRKNTRSFALKLWSTLPTQFQNRSLLKCSA